MKSIYRFKFFVIAALFFGLVFPALAQMGPELQMAELSKKLQLTDQQKKELTPIVEERDKQVKALKADTSTGNCKSCARLRRSRRTSGIRQQSI
jgi:hypothetical protein